MDRQPEPALASVAWIAFAPVKSLALVGLDRVTVGPNGLPNDRAFAVLDEEGRLLNGKRAGRLALVRPALDPTAETLALRFPDGSEAAGPLVVGEAMEGSFFKQPTRVHLVDGPWSEALSSFLGRRVRLVKIDEPGTGPDRGPSVSAFSMAALARLARDGGAAEPLDPRRFRMSFGIDGIDAYGEDRWVDRRVRIGEAVVEVAGNVGRCAVTTHDPDTGEPTFDTLRTLRLTRGSLETTEPLAFGVWARVIEPGPVALGDPVEPL
jgi:hypothetical protein